MAILDLEVCAGLQGVSECPFHHEADISTVSPIYFSMILPLVWYPPVSHHDTPSNPGATASNPSNPSVIDNYPQYWLFKKLIIISSKKQLITILWALGGQSLIPQEKKDIGKKLEWPGKFQLNTSLVAPVAPTHRLQNPKWALEGPKMADGCGKMCTPRFLGATVNFH